MNFIDYLLTGKLSDLLPMVIYNLLVDANSKE